MDSQRSVVPLPPPRRAAAAGPAGEPANVAAEHRELRESVARLLSLTDLPVLVYELTTLHDLLARHFATEDGAGGLRDAVGQSSPQLLPRLDGILAEHAELLALADEARAAALACWRGPAADVLRGVVLLAARLRAHEQAEEAILADSIYQDLGAGH